MAADQLSATLSALADPTRRALLARLAAGDATVGELARPYAMTVAAVSKHLKVLESAGLVSRTGGSQRRPCRLEAGPLADAWSWLGEYRRFWDSNLDSLGLHLAAMKRQAAKREAAAKPLKPRSKP